MEKGFISILMVIDTKGTSIKEGGMVKESSTSLMERNMRANGKMILKRAKEFYIH